MLKPYYSDDASGIVIYCGKAEQILPFVEADTLVTDPPYGIGADKNLRANTRFGSQVTYCKDYGKGDWDGEVPPQWLIDQAIAATDRAIIFGGNFFELPPSSCWLVWDKDNGSNGYADCELAWTNLPKAVRRIRFRWSGMLQEYGGDDKEPRFHPTQKPVPVMRWAINHVVGAQIILDPFMGVGTTLIAAKELRLKAIGIEQSERYCEIAANRLSQGVLPFAAV